MAGLEDGDLFALAAVELVDHVVAPGDHHYLAAVLDHAVAPADADDLAEHVGAGIFEDDVERAGLADRARPTLIAGDLDGLMRPALGGQVQTVGVDVDHRHVGPAGSGGLSGELPDQPRPDHQHTVGERGLGPADVVHSHRGYPEQGGVFGIDRVGQLDQQAVFGVDEELVMVLTRVDDVANPNRFAVGAEFGHSADVLIAVAVGQGRIRHGVVAAEQVVPLRAAGDAGKQRLDLELVAFGGGRLGPVGHEDLLASAVVHQLH